MRALVYVFWLMLAMPGMALAGISVTGLNGAPIKAGNSLSALSVTSIQGVISGDSVANISEVQVAFYDNTGGLITLTSVSANPLDAAPPDDFIGKTPEDTITIDKSGSWSIKLVNPIDLAAGTNTIKVRYLSLKTLDWVVGNNNSVANYKNNFSITAYEQDTGTLHLSVTPAMEDYGKNGSVYVVALIGSGLYAYDSKSQWVFVSGSPIPAYKSLQLTLDPISVNLPIAVPCGLPEIAIYAGYGLSTFDLVDARKYRLVHTIPHKECTDTSS